ncbi:MAG TPA: DNA polymerase III subunit chi [Rhodanobacteraceae bacterium]
MRADFYLIAQPRFSEQPLLLVCALVQKALLQTLPLVILARDHAQAEEIDDLLWAFDEDAFIPHQLAGHDDDTEVPVLIVPPGVDAPDRPLAINLRADMPQGHFERVLEVVPADPAERKGSRLRWRQYQQAGVELAKHDM